MKCMAWLLFEFNVEANIYVPFHNELKRTTTSSLINCFDLFRQMLSFNPIVLPIIYQRRTSILSNIRQFHSRCSSAAIKCSTSKHMIVCFSSNELLWTIGDNWIACIMGCNGLISLQISPSIAWLSILTIHFIIGNGWLVCIRTKCQPCSRIHLSTQVVAYIYSWKSVSYREGTWLIFFINDVKREWNGCFLFFMKFFEV